MELGVGIPQIKGCCQWVLISAMSMIGIKRLRMSHKISMDYVGIQPTASQNPPRRAESGAPRSGSE
ncbi:protein pleiotropic regulator PRL2-like [Pyrus ussuriensis x Pyrus communis]|uniref:Protein pleiotropic regulator PRL2-like n=1 Tax=Pyrus ussuriensis x Pyrus communis TaxID=2448454 RepID=A0A5N5FND4_9ROSA|nr:protein pleiotropic regulator PRL2-like [Pyrus ussuriensis x Pyrus communis]